jgi:S-layer protein (TIGR01567 family)
MKLAIDAEGRKMGTAGLLGLLVLLALSAMTIGASAQAPEALVRGSFSDGNGSWNAESFGWFYYDLGEGVGGERLNVEAEGREVKEGHLIYSSEVWTEEFDFDEWGRYEAVAFLGKRYLAGYLDSDFTDAVSALEEGEFREVLIDYEGIQTATSETPLYLNDGYWIEVAGASSDGGEVYLILKKNGLEVDRAVVKLDDTYVYEVGDEDLPIILAHVSAAMQGADMAIVDFNGIFQVRDLPTYKLETGDIVGLMEVTTLSEERIELENADDQILRRDGTITLVGNLMLRMRDTSSLIYYPLGAITEYGVQEIRGPVFSERSQVPISTATGEFVGYAQARWNYENFSGFYFDDDKKIGSENLIIHRTDGRNIKTITVSSDGKRLVDGVEYICFIHEVDFEFDPWGSYQVLCFLGDVWFVGYGPGARLDVDDISTLEQEQIGRVLIDTDQKDKAVAGEVYFLGEGYTLYIRDVVKDDVKEDKIFIELRKNDQLLDSAVIKANSTYVYERDVGDVEDLPIIALHVESIFSDGDDQFAIIDGLFQVSDSQYLSIEPGDELAEMVVLVMSPNLGIYMVNTENIELKRDSRIDILPGISIAIADSDTLRYYIYKNEYVVPLPELADVYIPEEPVPSGGLANFSIFVRAGEIKSVTAETVDSEGKRVILGDLTASGVGARDEWLYSWQWNATVPALSDDGTILPESNIQGAVLQVNNSTDPVSVMVSFDGSGRISLIQDPAGEIYYISPTEYEKLGAAASYGEMASNETLRKRYVKVEPGVSEIRFFTVVDGSAVLTETSHQLWFSPQGLEPYLVRVGAPPGRYEVRLRVENIMDALQVTGLYFEVEGAETGEMGNETANVTSNHPSQESQETQERGRSIPAPGASAALLALGLAARLAGRR